MISTPPHPWLLLFPATYLVHILEEYYAGEGFPEWIGRISRVTLSKAQFLLINASLWVAMLAVTLTVRRVSTGGCLIVALGVIVALNGAGHLAGTISTRTYSPGLISGLVLWVPLGIYTCSRVMLLLSPLQILAGVAAGIGLQGIVSLIALAVGRRANE